MQNLKEEAVDEKMKGSGSYFIRGDSLKPSNCTAQC